MNVLYNTCYADPWIKVAQKLKDEQGFEPVYWIGYEDDNSKTLVPEAFPDCIYQDYYDAWKGIFPPQITKHFNEAYINIDFIKEYASFELQAIKMMDRMDTDQHSFSFMERQRHYRNMIKYCTACLNFLKVDVVICDYVPHRLFDYVFYLLCRFYNKKFVCFKAIHYPGRIIPITSLSTISDQIFICYKNILCSDQNVELLKAQLPNDIINSYNDIQKDYSQGRPQHVIICEIDDKNSSGFFPLLKKFIIDFYVNYKDRYIGKNGFLLKGIPTFHKVRNKSIESGYSSIFKYSYLKLKTSRFKKRLKRYYNSLVVEPDLSKPYVIFNLHYQPEETTSPCGDIFVDQRLCVETLVKYLPSDYLIYVKEHPTQFQSHVEGHTSRNKEYYNDLLRYTRLRFVPLNYDPFKLIKNSKAVATVSGTTGWEGMALRKPVIMFGLTWYEMYSGVLKITSEKSAEGIRAFIENFKYDERDLLCYLTAFSQKSVLAYSFRGDKQRVNQPENECVGNLANSIIEIVKSNT